MRVRWPGFRSHAVLAALAIAVIGVALWLLLPALPHTPHGEVPSPGSLASPAPVPWWMPASRAESDEDETPPEQADQPAEQVSLTVLVIDMAGRPVTHAEVEVRADPMDWDTSDESADEPSEVEASDDQPQWSIMDAGATDGGGRFVAQVALDTELVVWASDGTHQGMQRAYLDSFEPTSPPTRDPVDVTVEIAEPARLSGRVVDGHGHGIEAAEVIVAPHSGLPEQSLYTDRGGAFTLHTEMFGAYSVEVAHDDYLSALKEAVQLLPGRETEVDFVLEPAVHLSGVVRTAEGAPIANAVVEAAGPNPDDGWGRVFSGEDGRFVVNGLRPGIYSIGASAEGYRPVEQWNVHTGGPDLVLKLERGGAVSGTVRLVPAPGPSDQAVGEVLLSAAGGGELTYATGVPDAEVPHALFGSFAGEARYVADFVFEATGEGRFTVNGLPPGSYDLTVRVQPAAAQVRALRVEAGRTTEVSLQLPDANAAALEGTARWRNEPLARATVYLEGPATLDVSSDTAGHFVFPVLPTGDYSLELHASGEEPSIIFSASATVHLGAGEHQSLTLDAEREDVGADWQSDEDSWAPDAEIEQIDTALVVLNAPAGGGVERLFGGDHVLEIDGAEVGAIDTDDVLDRLYGAAGTPCTIVAERPMTGETVRVVLPRQRRIY